MALVHKSHECARDIREPKWHDQPLIKSHLSFESGLSLITHLLLESEFVSTQYPPPLRFILKRNIDLWSSSGMSSNLGMGCLYLIVILLIALLSTHNLINPSFLGTRRVRYGTWAPALSEQALRNELLHLTLNLCGVSWVHLKSGLISEYGTEY